MAQLFRVTSLNDSSRCQTFTFILPPATSTDDVVEILSRDFVYAGHKWRLRLRKSDGRLCPYVRLVDVGVGVRCVLDINFVLVNRDTFSQNEVFVERQRQFDVEHSEHGCNAFITLDDLQRRNFCDSRKEYLFEVSFKHVHTTFSHVITLCGTKTSSKCLLDYQRYDTSAFHFGDLDWACSFCPNMDVQANGVPRHMIQITRKTRLDTLCKLKYRVIVGEADKCFRTIMREDVFDFSGNGDGVYFTDDYLKYADGNRLLVNIELHSISHINRLKLNVFSQDAAAQCFDKDRQTWCLKPVSSMEDTEERLTLMLTYPDVSNVPRNYIRYVAYTMHILPGGNAKEAHTLSLMDDVSEQYYATLEPDRGFPMRTKLKMEDLRQDKQMWLDKIDHKLAIQIEWLSSYLLVHPSFNTYDDIYRKQVMQMRRELQALQNENYSLEKELHMYQMSIAEKCDSNGSNTPARTWSVSSNASNPGKVANGCLTSKLQVNAAMVAASLLVLPERRLSCEAVETIQHVQSRRSSVDTRSPSRISSPIPTEKFTHYPRSISGDITPNEDPNHKYAYIDKRTCSIRVRRGGGRGGSQSTSPRHSPPIMTHPHSNSPKQSPPSNQRKCNAEQSHSPVTGTDKALEKARRHPADVPVSPRHNSAIATKSTGKDHRNNSMYLLCEPHGDRLRSRSISDYAVSKNGAPEVVVPDERSVSRQELRPDDGHRRHRHHMPPADYVGRILEHQDCRTYNGYPRSISGYYK